MGKKGEGMLNAYYFSFCALKMVMLLIVETNSKVPCPVMNDTGFVNDRFMSTMNEGCIYLQVFY